MIIMYLKRLTITLCTLVFAVFFTVWINACKTEDGSSVSDYYACAYIVKREDHYNIGVEIHTNNRNIQQLNMFTNEEFGNLIYPLDIKEQDDGRHYYDSGKAMSACFKEWLSVAINKENINDVLRIMREHEFEINLIDPDGNYPAIHESTTLNVIVEL